MSRRLLALAACLTLAAAPAQAAPDHYRTYVDGPWGQIHVRVEGAEGLPTILMVHKMVWSSVEFSKDQPLLAKAGYRTIAVDLPGYGLSDPPPQEPTADDYADALIPVLDHFHIKKVEYLGSDTGAVVGVAMALRHPDRIDHLIMDGVPLFDAPTTAKWLEEKEEDRTPTRDGSEFTRHLKTAPANISAEGLQQGTLALFQAGPRVLDGHHAVFKYALAEGYKRDRVPTMVLMYPHKGSIGSLPTVKALRPDFTYVMLDIPSQLGDFDYPGPWSQAVVDYLRSVGVK
jgi:pimeloyl-ACP methyl ester carboxylesterase